MRRPPIDEKTARLGHIDVVIAQQFELIEHQQQTRGIAAGVDAIELMDVIHVFGAGPRHVIFRAGDRTNALVEPGARCCNCLALCRRR